MNRRHNRETVFLADEDRGYFLRLLQRYRDRFHLRLYHSCLISNLFHPLVPMEDPRQLSAWVAGLLPAYYFHGRSQFVGHLWSWPAARVSSERARVEALVRGLAGGNC